MAESEPLYTSGIDAIANRHDGCIMDAGRELSGHSAVKASAVRKLVLQG